MRIAIIGTGISGLTAAYLLNRSHDITVFESEDRLGGHTATKDVSMDGQDYAIDTGFIVFNDRTYPNFIKLLDRLGVQSQNTEMSFSVSCEQTGIEYSGSNLDTLFAQRRNLLSPYFLRLVRDILRFNKHALSDLESGQLPADMTLGDYLKQEGYGEGFVRHYLVPMTAAIWSASTDVVMAFPLVFFVRFFKNHGLLSISNRPQWKTIVGGSREYIGPLTASFADKIRLSTPVLKVEREGELVSVHSEAFGKEHFDHVIFATHSDQVLALTDGLDSKEQAALAAIPYQDNDVVLHTDTSQLPKRQKTWSSWNYQLTRFQQEQAVLTYDMNILQRINAPHTFCVTLNNSEAIDRSKILGSYNYSHPVFTLEGMKAQQDIQDLNGKNRLWFCGAWCRNGFHEDGVWSALQVASAFGESL